MTKPNKFVLVYIVLLLLAIAFLAPGEEPLHNDGLTQAERRESERTYWYEGIAIIEDEVAADTYMEGEQIPTFPEPAEDEPGWDCRTDGDKGCGSAVIDGACVYYPDNTSTCRDREGNRYWVTDTTVPSTN